MNQQVTNRDGDAQDGYGVVTEPGTVRFERLLPGPIERVWSYLTESDKRRTWLASGEMELQVGGRVELIWRNSELTGTMTRHRPSTHSTAQNTACKAASPRASRRGCLPSRGAAPAGIPKSASSSFRAPTR